MKTDRLLNGLTDQKNGTRTVNITAKVAPHSLTWTGLNAGTGTGNFTGKMVQLLTSTDASTGTKTGNDTVRTGPLSSTLTVRNTGIYTANATEYPDGVTEYWLYGKRHRGDGPAVEWPNNKKRWYQHGQLHREDGPAIIYGNHKEWWVNCEKIREEG